MLLPGTVTVVEVGPRDGLQSLSQIFETHEKVAMIERILATGVREIEATSFVHPKVVPQLADAESLLARLPRPSGVRYRGLVPNRQGAERAAAAGIDSILGLISASERYSIRNQNMTVEQALNALEEVAEVAHDAGIPLYPVVAMTFFSPWEGFIPSEQVMELLAQVMTLHPAGIGVATTMGMAGPGRVGRLCREIREEWPDLSLGIHLHNTNGMALACALSALEAGVSWLESSVCGIGGGVASPRISPHAGNVATEDLVSMLGDLGIDCGIDAEESVRAARDVAGMLGLEDTGFTARAGTPSEVVARTVGTT